MATKVVPEPDTDLDLVARYSCQLNEDAWSKRIPWKYGDIDEPERPSVAHLELISSSLKSIVEVPAHLVPSLGSLDQLPLEVIHLVVGFLDLRSATRFSRVSTKGLAVIQSSTLYRDLINLVPEAISTLRRTDTLRHHSMALLHRALRSQHCVSCGFFGAFLFFPTCERCCYECVASNRSLWVIPREFAAKCFNLDAHHLKELPQMRNIPGARELFGRKLSGRKSFYQNRQMKPVSVKLAKELALRVHGSTSNMPDWTRPTEWKTDHRRWMKCELYDYLRWIQEAPLKPLDRDSVLLEDEKTEGPFERQFGMASIPFPSLLPDGTLENGVLCNGCAWMGSSLDLKEDRDRKDALQDLFQPDGGFGDYELNYIYECLPLRAWSKDDFASHARKCYGVKRLPGGASLGS